MKPRMTLTVDDEGDVWLRTEVGDDHTESTLLGPVEECEAGVPGELMEEYEAVLGEWRERCEAGAGYRSEATYHWNRR